MKKTPEFAWDAIVEYFNIKKNSSEWANVILDTSVQKAFIDTFVDSYNKILHNYMDKSVKYLDRHKQAAILIHCIIKCNIFKLGKELKSDEIFVGAEQMALLVGLAYMKDRLNEILSVKKIKPIDSYVMPTVLSCQTEYFDILTRDLYLQNYTDSSVYILFLAHLLFLLEYQTLREKRIDIEQLKEWNKNGINT